MTALDRNGSVPAIPNVATQTSFGLQPLLSVQAAWLAWIEDLLRNNHLPLSGNVDQWIRTWGEAVSQIGLLNINVAGSSNPQLEKRIAANYSYGRQLGRMLDMLAPLVKEKAPLLKGKAGVKAFDEFQAMADDIRRLKTPSVPDVVHQVKQWQASPTFEKDLTALLQQLKELSASNA